MLYGTALLWFLSLLEKNFFLLEDLNDFLTKFNVKFGKTDRIQIATTKIRLLLQESRSALVYTTDFCQLTCDVDWDGNALNNVIR